MRFKFFFIPLLFSLIFIGCKNSSLVGDDQSVQNQLDLAIQKIYLEHPNSKGILFYVECPDQGISHGKGFGYSNFKEQTPIQDNQPFLIASNTKTYMSVAILRLIEQGKMELNTPISKLLPFHIHKLFKEDGYDTKNITVRHLLTHTSGIFDYVDAEKFFATLETDPMYKWTRDEQLKLAVEGGDPLGDPGQLFKYADTNYLLLGVIIQSITEKPFYTGVRELIDYKKHGLQNTWFYSLEEKPELAMELVTQYATGLKTDSKSLDISFDLYGGGGIASTAEDLAKFGYKLFNNEIFDQKETLDKMRTKADPLEPMEGEYYLGLSSSEFDGVYGIGHGGFWGTSMNYIPELNATISVCILERDERKLRFEVNEAIVKVLQKTEP